MKKVKEYLKKIFTKTTIIAIIVLFFLSLFLFWGWYIKQFNKIFGYYYVYKGDKFYKIGKLQKAIDNYRVGLAHYPEHSKARCNLGNIYVIYEDFLSASESYETALKYSPNFIICRMNLGIVLAEKMAEYDRAIENYEKIIKSHPFVWNIPFIFNNRRSTKINKGIAYYNMGLAYRGKSLMVGNDPILYAKYLYKAKECYEKALKILKIDYDAQYNLALTNHLLGEYNEAGINYCKAINLKPMQFDSHYNLALLLRAMGYYRESMEELEKAGLLVDTSDNDPNKIKYIYDVLNDVNTRIVEGSRRDIFEYVNEKDKISNNDNITEITQPDIIYSNGKVVLNEKDEHLVIKNMRKCTSKPLFLEANQK